MMPTMNAGVRLDWRKMLTWSIVVILVALEIYLWVHLGRVAPNRRVAFLLRKTPGILTSAAMLGSLWTLMTALVVRFLVGPVVAHWHTPLCQGGTHLFHMGASERLVASTPARRRWGWRWTAGRLVRTNHRLWFFPEAHDIEVWSCALEDIHDVALQPAPEVAWGLIRHWPERVAVRPVWAERPELFAVSDPRSVFSWFSPPVPVSASSSVV
jgi:hypothetical protein